MFGEGYMHPRYPLILAICFSGLACGPQKASPESPSSAAEESSSESGSESAGDDSAATGDETAASDDSSSGSAGADKPKGKPLSQLCNTMCGAQTSKCKPAQIEACKHNYCERYGDPPEACEPSVRSALECGESDPDFLLCSNIVPDSCAKKFKAAETCLSTGTPPEAEEGPKMPAGWAKYQAKDANFTVTMPKDVAVKTEGGVKTWSAEAGGAKYEIRREAAPAQKKWDQRGFLNVAPKVLAPCTKGLKLTSLVERDDRNFIQFKGPCPDKMQQRGVLYVQGSDLFVVRATWQAGTPNPDADTFAYSFDRP